MKDSILVTGSGGGIGKYIHERIGGIGGVGFTRQSGGLDELKKRNFDVIIHCAFNNMPTWLVNDQNLDRYFLDNTLLTHELLDIPHNYFVFFSTIDIYPRSDQVHSEDEIIFANSIRSIHGTTKILSECLVKNRVKNYLILRPTFLLGPYMRKNNLLKLVEDKNPVLSVDSSSVCNVIHCSDVLNFINEAISCREVGTFNLASTGNVSFSRIAEIMNKDVTFGAYHYEAGKISNDKAVQIYPVFKKTSEEVFLRFLREKTQ